MSQPATPWIDVRDRLPEHDDSVLVVCERLGGWRFVEMAYWNRLSNGEWYFENDRNGVIVTHWMPEPPLPPPVSL